jgi:ABC-type lipoprotein export system ATPase subunit
MKNRTNKNEKTVLEVRGLVKKYRREGLVRIVLNKINFSVKSNDFLGIIGPSGSGKSTLLNCIVGLEVSDEGLIYLNEKNFSDITDGDKAKIRAKEMGFVFRDNNLVEYLTVRENIELPLQLNGLGAFDIKAKVDEILKNFELTEIANKYITEITMLQALITTFGRAMAINPKIVFMDEPTGELNSYEKGEFFELINKVRKTENFAIVLFSHDSDIAMRMNKVLRFNDGKII